MTMVIACCLAICSHVQACAYHSGFRIQRIVLGLGSIGKVRANVTYCRNDRATQLVHNVVDRGTKLQRHGPMHDMHRMVCQIRGRTTGRPHIGKTLATQARRILPSAAQCISWVGLHGPPCCCRGFVRVRRQVKRLDASACIKLHRAL